MAPQETTPLLNNTPTRTSRSSSTTTPHEENRARSLAKKFKDEWPVIRILVAFFLWALAIFGPLASRMDRLRSFICADYYYAHPDLIPSIYQDFTTSSNSCSLKEIESNVSSFNLLLDLTHACMAALGLLFYSSLLSTKGRKPVFLIGTLAGIFHLLPYAVLPLGYPFSSRSEELLFSPRTTLYLIYGSSVMSGALAFEDLASLVSKALVADVSSPNSRMRNLTWLMLAMLTSVSLGPGLFSLIINIFPPLSASNLTTAVGIYLSYLEIGGHGPAPPIITPPPDQGDMSSHNNVITFLVGISLQLASGLWLTVFIPETVGLRDADKEMAHNATEGTSPAFSRLSVLSILLPKEIPSNDPSAPVQRDWRITRLTLVGQAALAGGLGLQTLVMFCGFFLQWGPDQVGVLISSMGTVRALVLLLLVPLVISLLSRIVKKPRELENLSEEDMERISKNPSQVEEVVEREEELEHDLEVDEGRGLEGQIQAEEESHRLLEMQENFERDEVLRSKLSLWRANIDLYLLKGSFLADMVGWIITFLGAQSLRTLPLYFGSCVVSFGVGAGGAIVSTGIAMVTDMYNQGMEVGGTAQQATDKLLGAITICDAIGRAWSPIMSSLIYRASLSSFPGASFLYSSLMYLIAYLLLLGIRAERT